LLVQWPGLENAGHACRAMRRELSLLPELVQGGIPMEGMGGPVGISSACIIYQHPLHHGQSRLCQVGCGVILQVICAGWVVLECCQRQGETLFDGCHQQRVDPVGFLLVSGDLTLQGVKVKSSSHFCCIRKVGVVCWRGGKGVWLVRGLGGGCWQWRCRRHWQQGVGFMPVGGVTIIGFSC